MTLPCSIAIDCPDAGPFENLSAEVLDTLDYWPTNWTSDPQSCISTVSQSAADACAESSA